AEAEIRKESGSRTTSGKVGLQIRLFFKDHEKVPLTDIWRKIKTTVLWTGYLPGCCRLSSCPACLQ
ncbi:mCG146256, partial [Mus musculus]